MLTPQDVRDIQIESKRPSNFTKSDWRNIRSMMRRIESTVKKRAAENPNRVKTEVFVCGTIPQVENVLEQLRIAGFECYCQMLDTPTHILTGYDEFYITVFWDTRKVGLYDKVKLSQ